MIIQMTREEMKEVSVPIPGTISPNITLEELGQMYKLVSVPIPGTISPNNIQKKINDCEHISFRPHSGDYISKFLHMM